MRPPIEEYLRDASLARLYLTSKEPLDQVFKRLIDVGNFALDLEARVRKLEQKRCTCGYDLKIGRIADPGCPIHPTWKTDTYPTGAKEMWGDYHDKEKP